MRTPIPSPRLAALLALCAAAAPAARARAAPASLHASPAAALAAPSCSIPGADRWREYRSAHFVLSTDAPRDRGAALVAELERLRAYVVAALFGEDVEVAGVARVVAYANVRRFREIAPEHASAFVKNDGWELTVVFPFEGLAPVPEMVAHELAHQIAWHHFPRQPTWFAEGLAMFVQTVGEERNDDRAAALGTHLVHGERQQGGRWAGYPSPELLKLLQQSMTVAPRELLEWRSAPDEDVPRFHTRSWLLYGYLWNKRSKAFTDFQERLASGDDPAAAWRATFPDLDPRSDEAMAKLDDELAMYRRSGRYASYQVKVGTVDVSFRDRAIPSADLHVLLARARPASASAAAAALPRADVDEALREDPLQPEALAERAREAGASIADAIRPVTAARPEDARAWLLLADAVPDPKEREAALRKAVSLARDGARANAELAWLLEHSGRAQEARPFAERALDLAPWNAAAVETLASVAFGIGQCKPALVLQRRALEYHRAGDRGADATRKRLAEYEAKCGAAPAPASAAPKP